MTPMPSSSPRTASPPSCPKCSRSPDSSSRSLYRRSLPPAHTDLSSASGKARFARALSAGTADIFFTLVSHYQTQSEPSYCGLTTLATILNSLHIDPNRIWKFPWRWYCEELLECCVTLDSIRKHGITLPQLVAVSQCEGARTTVHRSDLQTMRELVVKCTSGSGTILVACYDRKVLGQTGSGHFSPVAAYDADSDSVLVLDTARFKYGPHWIPLSDLVEATRSVDAQTGEQRAFITFERDDDEEEGDNGEKENGNGQRKKCWRNENCCCKQQRKENSSLQNGDVDSGTMPTAAPRQNG